MTLKTIFSFREIKDQKFLLETISEFCRLNGFEFVGESHEHFSEDYGKYGDEKYMESQPTIKVLRFYNKRLSACCFYVPDKCQVKFLENIHESDRRKKSFICLLDNFCALLNENNICYRLEVLEWHRTLAGQSNVETSPFRYMNPESAKKYASVYLLKKP